VIICKWLIKCSMCELLCGGESGLARNLPKDNKVCARPQSGTQDHTGTSHTVYNNWRNTEIRLFEFSEFLRKSEKL